MTSSSDHAVINPYVGPRTFTEKEGRFFFGREREARDLTARIVSERLLLFYAQSGAGKSSLLNARVIPKLRDEERFQVLPVGRVSGELPAGVAQVDNIYAFNLMTSLDQSDASPARLVQVTLSDFLARLARETAVNDEGQRVARWVYKPELAAEQAAADAQAAGGPRFALVIDQFEEIITAHPGRWREREAFFRQLNQALLDDPNLWVVLALREDYVAALDPYAELTFNRLRARFYMERMQVSNGLEAVRRPAELGRRPFAPGVAEQLVDELRQVRVPGRDDTIPGQYVEPVQLQVVCYQLWERLAEIVGMPDETPISFADLAEAGDVNQALEQFYAETLAAVLADNEVHKAGVSERGLRTWFDKELITETGTRGLVRQGTDETGGMPNDVVRALQSRFLVRGEARGGDVWIELVHDRFVEPIRQSNRTWFGRNLNPLILDARAWLDAGKPNSRLYSGSQLAAAAAQIRSNPAEFSEVERAFVDDGQQIEARRAARRQRVVAWVAVALALVFIAFAMWALSERAAAISAQRYAELQSATAESASTLAVASAATATAALATAQSASTAVAGALETQAADLIAQLTAVASVGATSSPQPSASLTRIVPPSRDTPTGYTVYRVRPGDTVFSILRSNNLTLSEFLRINPAFNPNNLQIGQTIRLPVQQTASTSTPIPTATSTANPTVVAQLTQLAQVQATQTTIASTPTVSSNDLYVVANWFRLHLYSEPSSSASEVTTVEPWKRARVLDASSAPWFLVEAPDGMTGWIDGTWRVYEGQPEVLPPDLRYRVIAEDSGLPFVYGEVARSEDGLENQVVFREQPNVLAPAIFNVPVGTEVIVHRINQGAAGDWSLVTLPNPNGSESIWTGYLPTYVLDETDAFK